MNSDQIIELCIVDISQEEDEQLLKDTLCLEDVFDKDFVQGKVGSVILNEDETIETIDDYMEYDVWIDGFVFTMYGSWIKPFKQPEVKKVTVAKDGYTSTDERPKKGSIPEIKVML